MNNKDQFIWVEKYRPASIKDVVLPSSVKKLMKGFVKKGELTNLLFYGNVGCGKTTCAKALADELGLVYIFVNGTACGVDTARYTFPEFASSMSMFDNKRRLIIIDEAEKMTDSFSQAFNSFVEEYSINCSFILTTNHPNQLSPAIRSRFNPICFDIPNKDEKKEMFTDFLNRTCEILEKESITYERKIIAKFIFDYFPDMRKSLNMLQAYSEGEGCIDIGILTKKDSEYENLLKILKAKDFKALIPFIQETELDFNNIVSYFILNYNKFDAMSIAVVIKLISDYDYKNVVVIHKQANLIAFLTDVMSNVSIL